MYNLSNAVELDRFNRRCKSLADKQSQVELREVQKRTLSQNSYLHSLLRYFSIETGYTLDETKDIIFKQICNEELFREVKEINGVEYLTYKSTTNLTTEEMTLAIQRFRNYSSKEAGIYLPEPHEKDYLHEIQLEINRYQNLQHI